MNLANPTPLNPTPLQKRRYLPVLWKFWLSHGISLGWMIFSIIISIPWVKELGEIVTLPAAIAIITGIAYIPGYLNAFLVVSLLFDRQPAFKTTAPTDPISILIACRNEEQGIAATLKQIAKQDYQGDLYIYVIDNNSTDATAQVAKKLGEELGLNVRILFAKKPGKNNALNKGLQFVETKHVITLDADTLLHPQAIRRLMSRMNSAPNNVCSVAGAILVRNSRENWLAKIQEWDYFLGIASIKRLQGLYQGTLVAQGAYSLYLTEVVKEVGGWPDAIGEDIVLTWAFLEKNYKVYFEPTAIAFTDVPTGFIHFARQRSRWARGMIEALKRVKPWQQPMVFTRYLTGSNLVMPYLDFVYTFVWIPGLILSLFGIFWIVGPHTLLVLPLTLLTNYILYRYQKGVFSELGLRIRRNIGGFFLYVLCYQMIMAPVSVWGYLQEFMRLRRIWK
ncbi:glycosyltransferase family 2 protein [Neobacillus mesonae]|uniref:glycosyltransferase family 2 protein n=1 Tax=Neobacillus mesonae TaxID=1193713 RepID=UPI002573F42D|nr:glycosyltransferase [Neobacillus mesonae]